MSWSCSWPAQAEMYIARRVLKTWSMREPVGRSKRLRAPQRSQRNRIKLKGGNLKKKIRGHSATDRIYLLLRASWQSASATGQLARHGLQKAAFRSRTLGPCMSSDVGQVGGIVRRLDSIKLRSSLAAIFRVPMGKALGNTLATLSVKMVRRKTSLHQSSCFKRHPDECEVVRSGARTLNTAAYGRNDQKHPKRKVQSIK